MIMVILSFQFFSLFLFYIHPKSVSAQLGYLSLKCTYLSSLIFYFICLPKRLITPLLVDETLQNEGSSSLFSSAFVWETLYVAFPLSPSLLLFTSGHYCIIHGGFGPYFLLLSSFILFCPHTHKTTRLTTVFLCVSLCVGVSNKNGDL